MFEFAHADLLSLINDIRASKRCEPNDILDLTISLDGTWKKRGHQSMYGVVFLIEADSGYCLDFETLSKRCEICEAKERTLTSAKFKSWVMQRSSIIRQDKSVFSMKHIDKHVRRPGMVVLVAWKKKVLRKSSKDLLEKVT